MRNREIRGRYYDEEGQEMQRIEEHKLLKCVSVETGSYCYTGAILFVCFFPRIILKYVFLQIAP
jgi:hypothetical protein